MIPTFPRSKALEITDKPILQPIIDRFAPHSDFNFTGLWTYDTHEDLRWSFLNDNLVIKTRDYLTGEEFFSFLGTSQVIKTIHAIQAYAKQIGILPHLKYITEQTISAETVSKFFVVKEDRDNFDYLLSIEDILTMPGEKFHKHRKLLHKFQRLYPTLFAEILDLSNPKIKHDIMNFFDLWATGKNKSTDEVEHERKAIMRVFDHYQQLSILAVGVYDQGLQSFFMVDRNHNQYSQSHFFKNNPTYPGIQQYVRQYTAKILYEQGIRFLNLEQDLGIPGLRTAKEQWNPVAYVKKYIIESNA